MSDTVLKDLYQVVLGRKAERQEGSYTCYLFDQGLDKILKKVGEESAETIIAAKNGVQERTVEEISDPALPPDGTAGGPGHPPGGGAGRAGPPQPENRQPEADENRGSRDLRRRRAGEENPLRRAFSFNSHPAAPAG